MPNDEGLSLAEQAEREQVGVVELLGERDRGVEARRGAGGIARGEREQAVQHLAVASRGAGLRRLVEALRARQPAGGLGRLAGEELNEGEPVAPVGGALGVAAVDPVVVDARPERDGALVLAHQVGGRGQALEVRGLERACGVGVRELRVGRPPLPRGERRPSLIDCVCHRCRVADHSGRASTTPDRSRG